MNDVLACDAKKKIVLTGGGTAGHVYPALAVKECLGKEYEVHYIGGNGMEKTIVAKEKDVYYHQINAVKLERKLTPKNLLIPFKLIRSIGRAKKLLKEIKPSVIFSKGGFVSLPVVIAGKKLGIPIVSHESDLSMGLANKIILKYCNKMCVAFEKTCEISPKCIYTGQPIRKKVLNGNKNNLSFINSLDRKKKTLLVVGGSSGAKFINEKVIENIDELLEKFNVVHLTGKGKVDELNKPRYIQVEYADNIGDYLNLADIVLSRAGSGAINEFLALKKPMFLIPLSKQCSRGDQIENANLYCKLGYAQMLEEENYSNQLFLEKLEYLVENDKNFIQNMQKAGIFNASEKIASILKEIEIKN